MRLATCALAQFQPAMGIPVRISAGTAREALPYDLRFKIGEAVPDWEALKLRDDPDALEERLIAKLNATGVDRFRHLLARIVAQAGASPAAATLVLLCFEDLSQPGAWCHRTMVAQWWTESTGELVPELGALPAAKRDSKNVG
jgi:hypothetical protein